MKQLSSKQEGTLSGIAAIIVLFTTMLNPVVSMIIAVVALVAFAIYKFMQK